MNNKYLVGTGNYWKTRQYKDSITELARLMQDQPMSGLETAVWWTEHVIRNQGAKHLRNPSADLPLYEYYLLDAIAFLVVVAIITLFIFGTVLKYLIRVVRLFSELEVFKKKLE
ncbi:hypothetical protein NQ315_000512 [Exocentrus adspersus]|uniref:Glucuronosyltransferase n=1 Tax=Exocentrus adspersus TaxID=1586481 RepID=A0AAV8VA27_9CUCU|nr:hypothetical protein NQ315_000512 [Exocentrus adspersus]